MCGFLLYYFTTHLTECQIDGKKHEAGTGTVTIMLLPIKFLMNEIEVLNVDKWME